MATDEYTPVAPSGKYGYTCSAAVTAGTLVEISGNDTVATAALTSLKVAGIAAFSQAQNGQVLVHPIDGLHETVVGTGTLTAGNPVKSDANGHIVLWVDGTDKPQALLGYVTVGATAPNKARWIGR